jgi:hypothetical protein
MFTTGFGVLSSPDSRSVCDMNEGDGEENQPPEAWRVGRREGGSGRAGERGGERGGE